MTTTNTDRTEVLVGTRTDFDDDGRRIISVGPLDIGVLRHDGRFYAYENRCVHQGGPVCEGRVIGRVEAVLAPDKTLVKERFSETEIHLVCRLLLEKKKLATGACAFDR